ncbi:hypothetical protein Q0F99_08925 [Rathayibacter oskolensis]|nr:hypothetical protein [Rathayibacter oskolensis]WKK72968.1 hypothetical protein Q0F99_08925 [Rathayibacter oskolensis]
MIGDADALPRHPVGAESGEVDRDHAAVLAEVHGELRERVVRHPDPVDQQEGATGVGAAGGVGAQLDPVDHMAHGGIASGEGHGPRLGTGARDRAGMRRGARVG